MTSWRAETICSVFWRAWWHSCNKNPQKLSWFKAEMIQKMCFNENWDTASCLLVTDSWPSPPELWTWAARLCNEGWTTGLPDAFHQLITVFWDEAEMSWTARNSYDLERHLHYRKWWYFLAFYLDYFPHFS